VYKLYYFRGASPLAVHVLLEELGVDYTLEEISMPDGEHESPRYLAINPKGRLPALETPKGILTENLAILAYLAETHRKPDLFIEDPFEFAQAQALNSYFASTLHIAYAHGRRGKRWSDDPAVIEGMKVKVAENLKAGAELIENHLLRGPWAMGERYTFCDPYLYMAERWIDTAEIDLSGYPKLAAHKAAMLERPAVKAALQKQGL
jgi:glutathione S-transferase